MAPWLGLTAFLPPVGLAGHIWVYSVECDEFSHNVVRETSILLLYTMKPYYVLYTTIYLYMVREHSPSLYFIYLYMPQPVVV